MANSTIAPSPKVFQGNAITDARYEMSVIEKQLVYILLADIKKADRKEGQLDYMIKIRDLEHYGQKTVTNYTILRDATKKLVGRVYEIWDKDKEGRKVLTQTALLSSAKYVEGTGTVQVTISKEIKPYLMDLAKGFTVYSLDYALSLKSVYSQRMYELLSRYKDLGVWQCDVDELKYILKLEDKYDGYGMFKKKVLDVARKELKEKTDLSFTIKEVKQSRKVAKLIFVIETKDNSASLEIEFDEKSKIHNKLINEFKLSKWQATQIVKQVDEKTIHKQLFNIRMQINDGNIKNVGGYTWKIFQRAGTK